MLKEAVDRYVDAVRTREAAEERLAQRTEGLKESLKGCLAEEVNATRELARLAGIPPYGEKYLTAGLGLAVKVSRGTDGQDSAYAKLVELETPEDV